MQESLGESVSASDTAAGSHDTYLLTRGRAWAVSLSLRGALSDQLLNASFGGMDDDDLLYRFVAILNFSALVSIKIYPLISEAVNFLTYGDM